ncbi:hypothetical protein BDB00DRAFT_875380 [Zychaea mexicana]|uniref:uncharacterized protein n=1 Tax=Zychaea mexicana TaxID=64656 RepID=UPI0022FECC98|nr:uncharacterized protein BDB00DRAFT_875380 [Zychaea mexicana]KAI9490322.1 hypothetical protein BDB00DRAFT_875380 [Zychaea mexicana]
MNENNNPTHRTSSTPPPIGIATTILKDEVEPPSLNSLAETIIAVADGFSTLDKEMIIMSEANESLKRLNRSFGSFMVGLTAHSSGLRYSHVPDFSASNITASESSSSSTTAAVSSKPSSHRAVQQGRVEKNTQKGRQFPSRVNIRKIIDGLPRQFREQSEYTNYMEKVLRQLMKVPQGSTLAELAKNTQLQPHKVTECLKELIHSKHVFKQPHRGKLTTYQLNPDRNPSK